MVCFIANIFVLNCNVVKKPPNNRQFVGPHFPILDVYFHSFGSLPDFWQSSVELRAVTYKASIQKKNMGKT